MDVVLACLVICAALGTSAGRPLPPFHLKCEGNPVGLSKQDLRHPNRISPLFATDRPNPLFSWTVAHTERGARQNALQLVVAKDHEMAKQFWDSGVLATSNDSIRYSGPPLGSGQLYFWIVRWWDDEGRVAQSREVGHFMTGVMDPRDWSPAQWITAPSTISSLPRMFKSIPTSKPIAQAVLFASGLGYSRIYVNGADLHRISDPPIALNPGWTNYEVRVPYSVYDITIYLRNRNPATVEVLLGIGWRDTSVYPYRDVTPPVPDTSARVLRAILNITYSDGTFQSIVTDGTWSASTTPYISDSIYDGETYDARQGGGASVVGQALVVSGPSGQMYLPSIPYIAETGSDAPVAIYRLASDASKQIVDFGNNTAGVCRINVAGLASGTVVQMRHAEVPQHPPYGPQDGSLYYDNLRGAKQTDVYTCNGSDTTYQPSFTYHGFRYAEVTGYPRDLSPADIVKVNVHSNLLPNGQLHTSDPTLLAIQASVVRGQLSNLMSVPTDCDQRDERLGWMGDAGLSSDSMLLNFHMDSFFPHYAQLMADDQMKGSSLPDVVPFYR